MRKAQLPGPSVKYTATILLLAALLLLCACDSLPALSNRVVEPSIKATMNPTAEPTSIVIAALTPEPVVTAPPSPTPTPVPTEVPTPTPTPTPLPTPDPNRRMIALTFDDGPVTEFTAQILDLLKQYGIHATFFIQGNKIGGDEEVLCRIVDEGHELGLHGWNHTKMTEQSKDEMRSHFSNTAERVALALGEERSYSIRLMRPPYGSTSGSVYSAMRDLGLSVIKWTVDSRDWELRDTDAIVELCTELKGDGQIWLFHDKFQPTVDAVALLIPLLLNEGYDLVTVSALIESSGQPLEAGKAYLAKPTE